MRRIACSLVLFLTLVSACATRTASRGSMTAQPLIARMWHGRTTDARADEYFDYLNHQGVDKLRQIPGNMGVDVFRRSHDGETEFVVISYWPSLDAIHAYAGADIEKVHNLPRDAEFLIEPELTVRHFEIRRSERSSPVKR